MDYTGQVKEFTRLEKSIHTYHVGLKLEKEREKRRHNPENKCVICLSHGASITAFAAGVLFI